MVRSFGFFDTSTSFVPYPGGPAWGLQSPGALQAPGPTGLLEALFYLDLYGRGSSPAALGFGPMAHPLFSGDPMASLFGSSSPYGLDIPSGVGAGDQQIPPELAQAFLELVALLVMYYAMGSASLDQGGGGCCSGRCLGNTGGGGGWNQGGPASWGGNMNAAGMPNAALLATSSHQPGSGGSLDAAYAVLGQNAADIKYYGLLADEMADWPGNDVCCANFVSACLEQSGWIDGWQHNDNVQGLSNNLRNDESWAEVDPSRLKPGDVVVTNGGGHVVLFAGWTPDGQMKLIGSNNVNDDGSQRVSEYTLSPASAVTCFTYLGARA